MSLNQLIDTSTTENRKYLNVKVNSLNNLGAMKFDNNAGTNDQIIRNINGLPQWASIAAVTPRCRVAMFSPAGQSLPGGLSDTTPQNIVNVDSSPLIDEFYYTEIGNNSIVTHPNLTDFVFQKTGIYLVILFAPVVSNSNSVGFAFLLDEDPTYKSGWGATCPIDNDKFPDIPGNLNAAGSALTISRLFSVTPNTKLQIQSRKQAQNSILSEDNYYVGSRSASLSFVYLGENDSS